MGLAKKLDRFLLKIRKGKAKEKGSSPVSSSSADSQHFSFRSLSPSESSTNEADVHARSVIPGSVAPRPLPTTKGLSSDDRSLRSGMTTPTGNNTGSTPAPSNLHNPSITSVLSDSSGRSTPQSNLNRAEERVKENSPMSTPKSQQRRRMIPKDDFGHAQMMAILDYKGLRPKQPVPPLDPVDELLFGAPLDLDSLHPQVRDIYASGFKQLEEMDKVLDTYIQRSVVGAF